MILFDHHYISSFLRITFALIMIQKIFFAIKAFDFHWAHLRDNLEEKKIKFLLFFFFFLLVFFCIGILTNYISILIYFLYLYLFKKSSSFGLGDVYLTILAFYLAVADSSKFSIDSFYGLEFKPIFFNGTMIPEIFLMLLLSIIFYSAGIEKLSSPIWKEGKGVKLFFANPKFRKINLEQITQNKKLMKILNWIMIYIQFLLIFSLIFLQPKFSLVIIIGLIGFLLSLLLFFHFVDLALPCFVILISTLFFCYNIYEEYIIFKLFGYFYGLTIFDKFFFGLFCSLIFISIITVSVPYKTKIENSFLSKIYKYFKSTSRNFFGLMHISAYNEDHLSNPISFRIFCKLQNNKTLELFRLYNEDGSPFLKNTFFLPTVYLSTSFKLLDVLLEIEKFGKLSAHNRRFLNGYISFLLKKQTILYKNVKKITLKIIQFNLHDYKYAEGKSNLDKKMYPVLEISFDQKKKILFKKTKPKIFRYTTKRFIENNRYTFNQS